MALAVLERVERGADGQSGAVDIGQHHLLPVVDVALLEAAWRAEAGVGEGDVDPPEGVERGLDERLLLVPLGDIAGDGDRPPSPPSSSASASILSVERAARTRR